MAVRRRHRRVAAAHRPAARRREPDAVDCRRCRRRAVARLWVLRAVVRRRHPAAAAGDRAGADRSAGARVRGAGRASRPACCSVSPRRFAPRGRTWSPALKDVTRPSDIAGGCSRCGHCWSCRRSRCRSSPWSQRRCSHAACSARRRSTRASRRPACSSARVNPGREGYSEARGLIFYEQLAERLATMPGVRAAAIAQSAPFGGGFSRSILLEGQDATRGDRILIQVNRVGLRYFETLGIPLVAGRDFTSADRDGLAARGRHQPDDGREAVARRSRRSAGGSASSVTTRPPKWQAW